ncbi:MAG TPA: BrnT family toxin [Caulobacteraceae bacterium]
MRLEFDWDPANAQTNSAKHGLNFYQAMDVFADPLALSRLDDPPVSSEERWVTVGRVQMGVLTVVHTHVELAGDRIAIRIISARHATRREARQYEEGMEL